ncbi:hypothetical protein LJC48_04685 [Desulfovibrio sp. OttesenSCG-928-C06]|nr:hypothetical protein [Desulfovibrio sp. OttesenSCG-928-C06]
MPTINVRVNDDLKAQFEQAVRMSDDNVSDVLRSFMKGYVQAARENRAYEDWFIQNVRVGWEQSLSGRTVPDSLMKERAAARRERLLAGAKG